MSILRNFIRQKVDDITFGNNKACSLQEALDFRRTTRNISNDLRVTNSFERKLMSRDFGAKTRQSGSDYHQSMLTLDRSHESSNNFLSTVAAANNSDEARRMAAERQYLAIDLNASG